MKNVINRALVAKKRNILTLVLAIVRSVWMMSEALCIPQAPNNLYLSYTTISGTFHLLSTPCEEGEVCPPCRTPAIITSDKTYYLSSSNQEVRDILERTGTVVVPAIYYRLEAKASGTPYTDGSFDFLAVNNLNSLYIQYFFEQNNNPSQPMFPSDTRWHYVLNILTGEPEPIIKYYSIEPIDTLINNTRYQKIQDVLFRSSGAKVWCALDRAGTLVERLVYDFDLQVGDSIPTYYGGVYVEEVFEDTYDHSYAKVTNVEYIKLADGRMARRISYDYRSDDIEHIGSVKGILAPLSYPGHPDSWSSLLCCTRSDFLLYEAESGACDTFLVNVQHTDTIPLYARDDSGSSTVDPVDPNQIYATLTGDVLTVHNNTGAQVTFTLNKTSVNNVAARVRKNGQPTTFTESISVELSEDGIYEILLTSEEWNYSVFGTINYVRSATTITKEDPASTTKKLLRGTQILIEREGKTYTLTGQEVK